MKTAVITGASSGLGVEFAKACEKLRPDIEEIWLIARREDKLLKAAQQIKVKTKVIRADITNTDDVNNLKNILSEEKPDISLLINNAGFGKLGNFDELSSEENAAMVRLNCEALTVMSAICLPFMNKGGEIINSCSIASFAPNTRMAVYSSTKAYVMSLSRAMRSELKGRKINVIAICPGPMSTEFLSVAGIEKGNSFTFDTLPRVNPKTMAEKSLQASSKKRSVYTCRAFYKFYRILAKILPHSLVMKMCGT